MKLALRLKIQLKKILVLAIALSVVVLVLGIVSSTVQIKNRANQFIVASIEEIAQSEVISQNVSDIDREVTKLYEVWRTTQDIDTRIGVYVGGTLVSHAGPLAQFGPLSYSTNKKIQMPNGDTLDVFVDLDLSKQILFDLLTFAAFFLFLSGGYYLIQRNLHQIVKSISGPLEERVTWLTQASKILPDSILNYPVLEKSDLEEVAALDLSLKVFVDQIKNLEERVAKANYEKGRIQIAEDFAHSTKGSLGILRLRIKNAKGLSVEDREKLNDAVNEVAKASKNLLNKNPTLTSSSKTDLDLPNVLEKVIQGRKELLGDSSRIIISLKNELKNQITIHALESNLVAALNNILDNAVDAVKGQGKIKIHVTENKDVTEVRISDNGCGIPKEILPKLMEERATFGKPEGNGLGLYHSKLHIEDLGGKIEIDSDLGVGTDVTILLPHVAEAPSKEIPIVLSPNGLLVVLDDQEIVHQMVKEMVKKQGAVNCVHLKSVEEFEYWLSEHGEGELGARTYWMDYDLNHSTENGLSLIERHSLQYEAYLVTGMAQDLKDRAKASNVRLISKSDIPNIHFLIKSMSDNQEIVLESGLA